MKDIPLETYIKPLKKYLDKKDIVEICINQEHEVMIEDIKGAWTITKDKNITRKVITELANYLANKTGQRFDAETPMFRGNLPNYNYRLQINGGAMVGSGIAVAIRVATAQRFELTSWMSESKANELIEHVKNGKTILICAGTGAGKTTLLNSLIPYIPETQRIITLEDTPELQVPHKNQVNLLKSGTGSDVAGLTYKDFINSITRLRPDRILMGEIDIGNALAFLRLSNSGHSGSISTIHAENGLEAIDALCMNVRMGGDAQGAQDPDIRAYAIKAIDYFIILKRKITPEGRFFSAKFMSTDEVLQSTPEL